jgi:predicted nucleic acid-binding Zn ribbon protein
MDDTLTICGCAASPMSMMLSESSTQVSGNGILHHDCRETGPTLSSK